MISIQPDIILRRQDSRLMRSQLVWTFIRCVKQKNFWMMEMQSGPTGGSVIGAIRVQDRIFLWTAQSVAHGADEITYFRWRTCLFGAEQFWHGILPHNGVPGRRYSEIQETIQILTPVMDDIHGIVQKPRPEYYFHMKMNGRYGFSLKILD